MSDTDTLGLILTFAGVCVVNGTALAGVWIHSKNRADRTDAKIDEVGVGVGEAASDAATAASEAATAAQRTLPVSNGFAPAVTRALRDIQDEQARAAEAATQDRTALRAAIDRLDGHIGDHASADVRRGTG